jgi:hypothetical protein
MLETGMKHIPTQVTISTVLFGIITFLANKQFDVVSFLPILDFD